MRTLALAPVSKAILIADLKKTGLDMADLEMLTGLRPLVLERYATDYDPWEIRKASHRTLLALWRNHQTTRPKGRLWRPAAGQLGSLGPEVRRIIP